MTDNATTITIPDGYLQGPNGTLIPKQNVKPMDQLKDELVRNAVKAAKEQQAALKAFKSAQVRAFESLNELMSQEYSSPLASKKGNAIVRSYDQTQAIKVQIADRIELGNELNHAKAIIDDLLKDWMQSSNANICKIINQKFQPDKQGNINVKDIISLKKLDIEDDSGRWADAMRAIDDAINVVSSKQFIRFYDTDAEGVEYQISLDIAKL